ncbi:MAG TPA: hypothetical protein VNN22_04460 [Verrucomicrobiae bacterium]|nr:hypothetical protein [Verrucomicrobiae bacterium]
MQRVLIQIINFSLLFLILVGVPAATRAEFGNWQISSATTARLIMFWGLGLAAGLNLLGAWKLIKDKQNRRLCWEWATVFSALWLAYFGFVRGLFNFEWLKQALQWVQKHF